MGMTFFARIALFGACATLAACSKSEETDVPVLEPSAEPVIADVETAPLEESLAPAYVGVWAAEAEWCGIQPGSADPSPIAITEGEFIGYENFCRIGFAEEGTDGGWRMELICEGEGVEYTDVTELSVDGDAMTLKRGEAPEATFVRCVDA